ncbi:MAG: hypothetical protein JWP81_1270 [Ferruginibacter sp.]|nr:hypothetical protein [Ferruginibacter sp.]
MTLDNVHIVGENGLKTIRLKNEKILSVEETGNSHSKQSTEINIDLSNALAFPGLINSHDHLDFNLFPQCGNRLYKNYTQWGKDIQNSNKETINAVLKIPIGLRVQWGLYKNLLNGITTVINHGKKLVVKDPMIDLHQDCHALHSVAFEKNWRYKLNRSQNALKSSVIHIAEGTDTAAQQETATLIKWNLFKRKLIGIHAVAMTEREAAHFKAIVWCPVSNIFLLGTTASIDLLKKSTNILFGMDSTLTAGWNIWEHLRLARNCQMLNDEELFNAVTKTAADVWGFDSGRLKANSIADIVVARKDAGLDNMNAFYSLNPGDILLVIKAGKILLFDASLYLQLFEKNLIPEPFSQVIMEGRKKFITGDLPALAANIQKHHTGIQFPFQ